METRYSKRIRALEERLLEGPGVLRPEKRRDVAGAGHAGEPVADAYIGRIRSAAYTIVDGTIDKLKAAGWTEDEIFELSICTAFGSARHRLHAGLNAIEGARDLEPRSFAVTQPHDGGE